MPGSFRRRLKGSGVTQAAFRIRIRNGGCIMAIDDHGRERETSNRSGRGGWKPGYGREGWDRDYPREGRFDRSHGPDYTREEWGGRGLEGQHGGERGGER
jgi:hypothetical protein